MTSKELSDLSENTIALIKDASFEEAHFSVALAQAYATLAVAAANREANEIHSFFWDALDARGLLYAK